MCFIANSLTPSEDILKRICFAHDSRTHMPQLIFRAWFLPQTHRRTEYYIYIISCRNLTGLLLRGVQMRNLRAEGQHHVKASRQFNYSSSVPTLLFVRTEAPPSPHTQNSCGCMLNLVQLLSKLLTDLKQWSLSHLLSDRARALFTHLSTPGEALPFTASTESLVFWVHCGLLT